MVMVVTAGREHADGMGRVLDAWRATGKRTGPGGSDHALSHYLEHPDRLACHVALDPAGRVLGFQSLKRASEGNAYGIRPGWGIIGTHVHPGGTRKGVGRALLATTRAAATAGGMSHIGAAIEPSNTVALRYYAAMGFELHGKRNGTVHRVLSLQGVAGAELMQL